MRDYEKLVKGLRYCFEHDDCGSRCPYFSPTTVCADERAKEAADAIEELLAASPPALWTDEPITGSEFMTHTGPVGFEIHFRTDSREKYMKVQEECRRQIGHAKPEPPKEVE